jgi:transposase InsO family protein
VSTIWRILTARGFVTPQPHKRPKSSYVRFQAAQPNERWQTDITHWPLADGTDAEILNWLDDHSRYCLASTTAAVFTALAVDRAYRAIADRQGDPAGVLTDNGPVFTGRYRGHGRVALEVTLHDRGVAFSHSRPYHPQTCGKVERFHQTLKKWLATQASAASEDQLQGQLDPFRDYYNAVRPHRALGRNTPAEAYAARPKAHASGIPLIDGHSGSGTTRSTTTANSRCATTAACTTSAWAADTPAHPSSCWSTTGTSGSSAPADNFSAT